MMNEKFPVTLAIRELLKHQVRFEQHLYAYEERGGTSTSARELGVDEHIIIKTLIMETDARSPLIVLMHGDKEVSTKQLARLLKVKSVSPCKPDVADKHSGYQVGGTSPLGTKRPMPVYMEASIAELPLIYVNGGKRGFLVSLSPKDLMKVLNPVLVSIAT